MTIRILPELVDPFRYADQGITIEGVVPFARMTRLLPSLYEQSSDQSASLVLRFSQDEQGVYLVSGHVSAVVSLVCQRCLDPFNYEIMSDFTLAVVRSLSEGESLSKHYEPVLVEEKGLNLSQLAEDELILHLPIVPKHELSECRHAQWEESHRSASKEEDVSNNPFRTLKRDHFKE